MKVFKDIINIFLFLKINRKFKNNFLYNIFINYSIEV